MKTSKKEIIKRQNNILEYLQKNLYAPVQEIADTFGISPATVRRDIATLKETGEIKKVFGGASLTDMNKILPQFDNERHLLSNIPEKEAIAKKAAELIKDGDTIFINSSSTALRIYPYIVNKNVNIVTNNGRSLYAFRNPGTELILIGGEVKSIKGSTKLSTTGEFAIETIKRISATKCILGVSGISVTGGLTSMAIDEPTINRAMIQQCHGDVIILADHRKLNITHNFLFGDISDVSVLITDSGSSPEHIQEFLNANVNVLVVDPEKSPSS